MRKYGMLFVNVDYMGAGLKFAFWLLKSDDFSQMFTLE